MFPTRRKLLTASVAGLLAGCSGTDEQTPGSDSSSPTPADSPTPPDETNTPGETDASTGTDGSTETDSATETDAPSETQPTGRLSPPSDVRQFGGTIAVSETTAVVGAEHADTGADAVATVFARAGGSWTRDAQITPETMDRSFGTVPVAAGERTIAAGPVAYDRTDGSWRRSRRLVPETESVSADCSVALDAGTAVVGAPSNEAAYVFERTDDSWVHRTTLTGDAGFGRAVAVADDRIVVGADGAIYVFDAGVRTATLTGDRTLGASLAVSNDTLVAGTPRLNDSSDNYSGGAVVFTRTADNWTRQTRLAPSDDGDEWLGNYGASLAVRDGTVVVSGSWHPTPQRQNGVRSVTTFERERGSWVQSRTIRSPRETAGGTLGPVAFARETLFVGAPTENDGVVYLVG